MATVNNSRSRTETADMIATAAIVFVRQARAEGYANKLTKETLDGVACELGISPSRWTWSTAVKMVRANAASMGEIHLVEL